MSQVADDGTVEPVTGSGASASVDRPIIVAVARARIGVVFTEARSDLQAEFLCAWGNAIIEGGVTFDSAVYVADLGATPVLADIANAIIQSGRTVLRNRDVWCVEALTLMDRRQGILVLTRGGTRPVIAAAPEGRFMSLGPSLVAIDPQGAMDVYSPPMIEQSTPADPRRGPRSEVDVVVRSTNTLRLSAIVIVEQGEQDTASRLPLGESLLQLPVADGMFVGSQRPLRSLARIIAEIGGVSVVRCSDHLQLIDMIESLEQQMDPVACEDVEVSVDVSVAEFDGSSDKIFRAGALDAIEAEHGQVLVLQDGSASLRITLLPRDQADIWRSASGVSIESLVRKTKTSEVPGTQTADIVESMLAAGLLARQPSWRVADAAAWTIDRESFVVLNLASQNAVPLALHDSASAVWAVLARHAPIGHGDLVSLVAEEYGVETEVVREDIDRLMRQLLVEGVVDSL